MLMEIWYEYFSLLIEYFELNILWYVQGIDFVNHLMLQGEFLM